jgi:DNA-binding NtrC family response regulator
MPAIKLTEDAIELVNHYSWPGNIRQLKNLVEQLSVIETKRELNAQALHSYLPAESEKLPSVINEGGAENISERELMYKFLFDMKKDLTDLKKLVVELLAQNGDLDLNTDQSATVNRFFQDINSGNHIQQRILPPVRAEKAVEEFSTAPDGFDFETHEIIEESLSLEDQEKELIQKALGKHRGKRKYAAAELGISERTLYRKIKEYNLFEL